MTDQRIKDMEPLAAAQAIFAAMPAALGIRHTPREHDQWGYAAATVGCIPGASLQLNIKSSGKRGMLRALVDGFGVTGHGVTETDISYPAGYFTMEQTPAQAAAAIARRLFNNGAAGLYIAALRRRLADRGKAAFYVDDTIARWRLAVRGECALLGFDMPENCYTEAHQGQGCRDVSPGGSFTVKLYGFANLPDVRIWSAGIDQPVNVIVNEMRSHVSFPTAAKICALVAFDKQSRY